MTLPAERLQALMWIGGKEAEAETAKRFDTTNPAHDTGIASYPLAGPRDVDAAVAAARAAFDSGPWPRMPGRHRARMLHGVAGLIRSGIKELACFETLESDKPIAQARGEVKAAVDLWDYAAALARHSYGDTCNTLGPDKLGFVLREPAGVVGMITPWNFPLLIISQ